MRVARRARWKGDPLGSKKLVFRCDAFDLTVEENQRICFWYRNLQPLWAEDNLKKSNAYTEADKQALISAYYNQ